MRTLDKAVGIGLGWLTEVGNFEKVHTVKIHIVGCIMGALECFGKGGGDARVEKFY